MINKNKDKSSKEEKVTGQKRIKGGYRKRLKRKKIEEEK